EEKKEGYKYFKKSITEAVKKIFKGVDRRELIIYDGRGVKEERIMNFIKEEGEAGTVVLIDYIQKIPAKDKMDKESYRRVL
ncbi:MAG: hypothetical protein LBL71_02135, partial [Endomicrobium sp.]|nr:hypothetical protein [Endomicrobium sp.]